jgi:hypothetical protein
MPDPTAVTRSRLPYIAIAVWAVILAAIVAVGLLFGGRGVPAGSDSSLAAAGAPGGVAQNLGAPLAADPSATPAPSAGNGTANPGQGNRGPKGPNGGGRGGFGPVPFAQGGFGPGGPGGFGGPGGPGGFGPGGPSAGRGPISIAAISGSNLSLRTDDGWTRTIDATGATITEQGGGSLTVADLKVGDHISFRETRNTDGTYKIDAIVRIPAQAGGTVTAVTATSATLSGPNGASQTIGLTGTTTYSLNGRAATSADLKVGTRVRAVGSQDSGGAFTATHVDIAPAEVDGTVTAKTDTSITIKDRSGASVTIHVDASTTYQARGNGTASLVAIAVGNNVEAEGTQNSDGSLNATVVRYGAPGPAGFGPPNGAPFNHQQPKPAASPAASANAG